MTIKLDISWLKELEEEFNKEYMNSLRAFLVEEKNKGKEIYPKGSQIFASLNLTPFKKLVESNSQDIDIMCLIE